MIKGNQAVWSVCSSLCTKHDVMFADLWLVESVG